MLDKCYKNIYIAILQFIPIDFHPVLRLVNSKFNRLISNKVCRLNRIMAYAEIDLLKFIQNQPNVHTFTMGKESSPYTLKSMLESGLHGRTDIMAWLKQNSKLWKYGSCSLNVDAILKLYQDETLSSTISMLFIRNSNCCRFLLRRGSPKQVKLFLDLQIASGINPNSESNHLLHELAVLTGDMEYVKIFAKFSQRNESVGKSAIKSLSIEMIDQHVEHKISNGLWLCALNTNCQTVINHIWNTRNFNNMYIPNYSSIKLSETTLNFLLSVDYNFYHSSIYSAIVDLPNYRTYFEKIYQLGHHPHIYIYAVVFGSEYAIDQINWLYEHGVDIKKYDGNDGDIEIYYDPVDYYDELFEVGTLKTFKFWHQLYYPKYVTVAGRGEETFIDHILVTAIKSHRIDIVDYILNQGYDLSKNYLNTALSFSTFEMCQCLIGHGFELDAKPADCDILGNYMKKTLNKLDSYDRYYNGPEFFIPDWTELQH